MRVFPAAPPMPARLGGAMDCLRSIWSRAPGGTAGLLSGWMMFQGRHPSGAGMRFPNVTNEDR